MSKTNDCQKMYRGYESIRHMYVQNICGLSVGAKKTLSETAKQNLWAIHHVSETRSSNSNHLSNVPRPFFDSLAVSARVVQRIRFAFVFRADGLYS